MTVKMVFKLLLLIMNCLIMLYIPVLKFSEKNTLILTLISVAIFLYFVFELISNRKNKQQLLMNSSLLAGCLLLPVIIFLLVFQFGG